MIKVLHYAPGFRSGGIESRLLDWYRNIDRDIVQFILVKLNYDDDTEDIKEFKKLGGILYNLPEFSLGNYSFFIRNIKHILLNEKIDIVHVHDLNSGYFVLKEAKKIGIKCRILHSRTTGYLPNERNMFVKPFLKRLARVYANQYFACSQEAGVWGCGKNKEIIVIKNGIQTDKYIFDLNVRSRLRKELGIEKKKVVGYIGRISTQKNIPFLLKVFSELAKTNEEYVLLIVGGGDQSIIQSYYGEKRIPNNVVLLGEKSDVWNYYMCMDVFCSPSYYEGFGTTAIEAQASGLPTIVSKGFPSVIQLTDFAYRLKTDLDNVKNWVDKIEECIGKRYPDYGLETVIKEGYCAKETSKFLLEFYKTHTQ